jgi:hypothetical protein
VLKNRIRSGDVAVTGSRNYKNFDEYDEYNEARPSYSGKLSTQTISVFLLGRLHAEHDDIGSDCQPNELPKQND